MEKKIKSGPLLFIPQSFSTLSVNKMQEVYTNKLEIHQKMGQTEQKEEVQRGFRLSPLKADTELITLEQKQEETSRSAHEKHRTSFKRVKSFKEMDVNERLAYLVNFPKALPPVPCVFYTEEKNVQGFLQEWQGEEITIVHHDQTTETIPISVLKDIIMIGIKR